MKAFLTRIWLICVAAYPIVMAIFQITDFCLWLKGCEYDIVSRAIIGPYSPLFLIISFIVSIRERFCIFHRLCIISVLLININHLWAVSITPILANHITLSLIIVALTGIIGAIIHFVIQIQDFIKYARIQSKKQDPYKGAVRA